VKNFSWYRHSLLEPGGEAA